MKTIVFVVLVLSLFSVVCIANVGTAYGPPYVCVTFGFFNSGVMFIGSTGSVLLRSGYLSELISELQALTIKIDENGESSDNLETAAILAAQVRHLEQEVRQLASSRPIRVGNGSGQSGNLASYLMLIAALGAMGYNYMWWKRWSFSDVMFVTKRNMTNAVACVTKQLDQLLTTLAATKRHLSQRIENLDGKMDEQKEISKLIKNEIRFNIDAIQKMVAGLEGKMETLEHKQDFAVAGVSYLCHLFGGMKDGHVLEVLQNFPVKGQLECAAPKFTEDKSGMVHLFELMMQVASVITDHTQICLALAMMLVGIVKIPSVE